MEKKSTTTAFFVFLTTILLTSCASVVRQDSQQYTCIPTQLFRCEPGEKNCLSIPIVRELGNVEIKINLTELKVSSYSGSELLSYSDIDSVEKENDLIYLSGKGYGFDHTHRIWNAIIDTKNGGLYSSSMTTGAGHITYGQCHD